MLQVTRGDSTPNMRDPDRLIDLEIGQRSKMLLRRLRKIGLHLWDLSHD